MAAPDLSAIVALGKKAGEFSQAGHLARATEYRKRALAAAQAMGAQDCLIVAFVRMDLAAPELRVALEHVLQHLDESPSEEWFAAAKTMYFASVDTLLRRRAAGTLMPGTCRATEEAWFMQSCMHALPIVPGERFVAADERTAPFMGYQLLMEAANHTFNLMRVVEMRLITLTTEQLQACMTITSAALDCFLRPRAGAFSLSTEAIFAVEMRRLMAAPDLIQPYGSVAAELLKRWRRVERSGELQRREIGNARAAERLRFDALAAAAEAAAAAPGLRCCALASCGAREQHPSHFKSCGACKTVAYCCREHQVEDWLSHKAACKAARKAAADDADASRDSAR